MFMTKETFASRNGLHFRAANGSEIKNHGEKVLEAISHDGCTVGMKCQVADVTRNLASFMKIIKEGNDVYLSTHRPSYIQNKNTGLKIPVRTSGSLPEFGVYVKRAKGSPVHVVNGQDIPVSGFQRLETAC